MLLQRFLTSGLATIALALGAGAGVAEANPVWFTIQAQHSGKCLTPRLNSWDAGALIVQQSCHFQNKEKWELLRQNDDTYMIRNANTGLCLDVSHADPTDHAPLVQYWCLNNANQRFELRRIDNLGHYEIRPRHAVNKCLDVTSALTRDDVHIQQHSCVGATNEHFSLHSA